MMNIKVHTTRVRYTVCLLCYNESSDVALDTRVLVLRTKMQVLVVINPPPSVAEYGLGYRS